MNTLKNKVILAIETSCDETAAAVLEISDSGKFPFVKTLSSVINSQTKLHSKMGGVVPEAAARAHVKNILPVVKKAISAVGGSASGGNDSQLTINDVDYIAVTQGPGLIPSLIVGVEFAKALSLATKKPIIPVNHMLGHLYSPLGKLGNKEIEKLFPMIALIVSGGHTLLVLMTNAYKYKVIGQTVDDAAGEAFDKVAKMLKLAYPGGPEVAKLSSKGDPRHFQFPRPMMNNKNYDFSFSGLKTAVLYRLRDFPKTKPADICASFEESVVDVLVTKAFRAVKEFKAKSISLSGGVSANQALRKALTEESKNNNIEFLPSPLSLSGDNAEMIGLAAAFMITKGYKPKSYKTIKADSNLEL